MDDSSSGFGDENRESPVLFKPYGRRFYVENPSNDLNLDELHKELLLHLKKTKIINRKQLVSYLEKVTKINAKGHKSRWLLMKVKGLLNFILKKRGDFRNSVVKGDITIYHKPMWEQNFSCNEPANKDQFSSSVDIPGSLLTNDNFVSMESTPELNLTNMEIGNSYNHSEDLFPDTAQSLHNFSLENYNILQNLTQNTQLSVDNSNYLSEDDDKLFKMPAAINKIEKVRKIHESLEENYSSITSMTPPAPQTFEIISVTLLEKCEQINIFDNTTGPDQKFLEEVNEEFVQTEIFLSEIVFDLTHLEIREIPSAQVSMEENKENSSMLTENSRKLCLKTFHSEENFRIIKETCAKFKENLEKKRSFEVLRDFNFRKNRKL